VLYEFPNLSNPPTISMYRPIEPNSVRSPPPHKLKKDTFLPYKQGLFTVPSPFQSKVPYTKNLTKNPIFHSKISTFFDSSTYHLLGIQNVLHRKNIVFIVFPMKMMGEGVLGRGRTPRRRNRPPPPFPIEKQ
jgi:hypothetical protein